MLYISAIVEKAVHGGSVPTQCSSGVRRLQPLLISWRSSWLGSFLQCRKSGDKFWVLSCKPSNKSCHDLLRYWSWCEVHSKVSTEWMESLLGRGWCEGDANLPFDEELSDIKISLRLENKLHHMLCPDVMYYGSRMVQVSPLDHVMGAGTIGYCSTVIVVSSQMVATLTNGYCSIADHLLSTIWMWTGMTIALSQYLQWSWKHQARCCCCRTERKERANSRDSLTSIVRRWPCRKSISWTLLLMARITVWPSIGDTAILLWSIC